MQVVITEKERRDSELEHKKVLEECKIVMENYRLIERKLRNHIIKSRLSQCVHVYLCVDVSTYLHCPGRTSRRDTE